MSKNKLIVAVICGGPSLERGISLNSARSLMDHLGSENIEIKPFYVNKYLEFFSISKSQLYSNTPLDFDFKLLIKGEKLSEAVEHLKGVDIVFPVIHGAFGEDGTIQKMLEENDIPFIGSSSESCKKMFNKSNASSLLHQNGFHTIHSMSISRDNYYTDKIHEQIKNFFIPEQQQSDSKT